MPGLPRSALGLCLPVQSPPLQSQGSRQKAGGCPGPGFSTGSLTAALPWRCLPDADLLGLESGPAVETGRSYRYRRSAVCPQWHCHEGTASPNNSLLPIGLGERECCCIGMLIDRELWPGVTKWLHVHLGSESWMTSTEAAEHPSFVVGLGADCSQQPWVGPWESHPEGTGNLSLSL